MMGAPLLVEQQRYIFTRARRHHQARRLAVAVITGLIIAPALWEAWLCLPSF